MPKKLVAASVILALVAVFLAATGTTATAGSFTRGCAARDLQLLKMIEERETGNPVSTEKLSDALFAMMSARMICYSGRVPDALELYERISRDITAVTMLSEQR